MDRRAPEVGPIKRTVIKLALAGTAVLAALGSVELWIAWRLPQPSMYADPSQEQIVLGRSIHRPATIPGLPYELQPGADAEHRPPEQKPKRVRVNSHGMRNPEVTLEKPPGVLRVAALGDSTTFGYGVEDDQTWPAFLQRSLNAAGTGRTWEVLNFGVTGYATTDEAIVLDRKARAFDPDVVVLGYNLNDPNRVPLDSPLHTYFSERPWWDRFQIGRFVRRRLRQSAIDRIGGGNVVRYWHAPDRPMWRSVQEGFADIAASAAELGAPVLCVIFTQGNPPADPAGYPYGDLHAQVAEEARRHGFDVLDLLELYARMRAEGVRSQLPHLHPNVEGQRAAAAAIAERILAWPDAPHRR